MKNLLRLLPLLALVLATLHAADLPAMVSATVGDKLLAAVRAADDERVAATIAADHARLTAIFSNELRYAHSSGKVDTKASYIQSLVSHNLVYLSFNYTERNFVPAAPGIVLMNGRLIARAGYGGKQPESDLNFLAVWREEKGKWRFLAWQSCKNPPPAPVPAK
ncbi:MAG: nuclear transport factor 2 family protein [Pedosphaera sp.]|nr:nuclear transport factor 2 family protein [Pedosphaera sp.]